MITLDEFQNFIEHDLAYEQRLVYIIDDDCKTKHIDNVGQLHSNYGKTIKVEGMEKYNSSIFNKTLEIAKTFSHDGPVTCHAFRSFENSKSFPKHTDPDDVFLQVICGEFVLHHLVHDIDTSIKLKEGDTFYIEANEPHWAIHTSPCLFLSFGLEKFLVNKL